MTIKAKVEGHPNLQRDMSTGAVQNTDRSGYQAYMQKQARDAAVSDRMDALENKMDTLIALLKERK